MLLETANKNIYFDQAKEDFTVDSSDDLSAGQFILLTDPVDILRNSTEREALKWTCKEWGLESKLKFLLVDADVHILTETFEW